MPRASSVELKVRPARLCGSWVRLSATDASRRRSASASLSCSRATIPPRPSTRQGPADRREPGPRRPPRRARRRPPPLALHPGQVGRPHERRGAPRSPVVPGSARARANQAAALGHRAMHPPEPVERRRQPQRASASPRSSSQPSAARRLPRSASRRSSHAGLLSTLVLHCGSSARARKCAAWASRTAGSSPLAARRSERTRGSSPASGSAARHPALPPAAEALVREPSDGTVEDGPDRLRRPRLGRLQREAAGEDGEPPEEGLLLGASRSWLQAIASRIVCSRAGTSRAPPVRSEQALLQAGPAAPRRQVRHPGGGQLDRQGSPSSRRTISATAGALRRSSAKSARAAWARSTKSRTASDSASSAGRQRAVSAGAEAARRRPARPTGARLAAGNQHVSPGQRQEGGHEGRGLPRPARSCPAPGAARGPPGARGQPLARGGRPPRGRRAPQPSPGDEAGTRDRRRAAPRPRRRRTRYPSPAAARPAPAGSFRCRRGRQGHEAHVGTAQESDTAATRSPGRSG